MSNYPFERTAAPVKITVSAASQSVAIPTEPGRQTVRVANNGTATVWIDFKAAGGSVTTENGMSVGPGVIELFTVTGISSTDLHAYVIAAGATGDVQFTVGVGY